MRSYRQRFLGFERRPAISGLVQEPVVGGEILPVNSLQLFLANFWWIFLLAIPILMCWLTAKHGVGIPPRLRLAFRLVPLVVRTIG